MRPISPQHSSDLLTLDQVAQRFQWNRRTVIRALQRHGIPTIGRRGLARGMDRPSIGARPAAGAT
jgi:hypothetical protein